MLPEQNKIVDFFFLPARFRRIFITAFVFLLFLSACKHDSQENLEASPNHAKIEISDNGFYRIKQKDLENAGIAFDSFSEDTLVLKTQDQNVPFYFNGDSLIFYGQAPTNRYTSSRPYILSTGENGTIMAETVFDSPEFETEKIDFITNKIHLEENHIYESQTRVHHDLGDVWFWETIRQGQSFAVDVELPAVADGGGSLTLQLVGISYNSEVDNDHDFDIYINEIPVGTIQFDGEVVHSQTLKIPPGTLKEGNNEILLDNTPEGAAFLDIMLLNWIDLAYHTPINTTNDMLLLEDINGQVSLSGFSDSPILFDITDPDTPQIITNIESNEDSFDMQMDASAQVAALGPKGMTTPNAILPVRESNWRNPDQQADLIILTTDELAPALDPLIQARSEEGINVALVPVEEIYDEFGGGEVSPNSLKKFITYAYEQWQSPQPRYLLLVGDATSDYRNYLDMAPPNIVPAPMVSVSYSGETVSDSILADTDGDGVPNMAVGRWPVNTPAEVSALVERTLAYEQGTAVDSTFFAADGTEPQFERIAQSIATNSKLSQDGLKILPALQADEVTSILNDGAWLATYIGHGSLRQWGKDDVFTQEAVTNLNTDTPPIVIQLTCLTGLFTQPEQTSLTELLLNHESGPVLTVAATSLTLSSNQEPFATSLIQNLNDPTVERIGDAFQSAKLSLDINNQGLREISDTFALFGDPSARIVRPES